MKATGRKLAACEGMQAITISNDAKERGAVIFALLTTRPAFSPATERFQPANRPLQEFAQ